MRKGWIPVLVVTALMVTASIALARGAPSEKVFTDQAIVSVDPPAVAGGSPMTVGFDVTQNYSTAVIRIGNAQPITVDTSTQVRQSTTVAEYGVTLGAYSARSGPSPDLVLLA